MRRISKSGFEDVLKMTDMNRRQELDNYIKELENKKRGIMVDAGNDMTSAQELINNDPTIKELMKKIEGLQNHLKISKTFQELKGVYQMNKIPTVIIDPKFAQATGNEMVVDEKPIGETMVDEVPQDVSVVEEKPKEEMEVEESPKEEILVKLRKTPNDFFQAIDEIPKWSRDNLLSVRYALDYLEALNTDLSAILTDENYVVDYGVLKQYNKVQIKLDQLINEMGSIIKAVEDVALAGQPKGKAKAKADLQPRMQKVATTPRSVEVVDPFISKVTRKAIRRVITDGKSIKQAITELKDLFKLSDRDVAHIILQMEDFGLLPDGAEHLVTGRFTNSTYYC